MPDYIRSNSKRCAKELYCTKQKFQSYNAATFGQVLPVKGPISCKLQQGCNLNQINYQKYVLKQQNLYARMRHHPEQFGIISWVKNMNLTPGEQRAYSNMWYKRLGTSQSLPVNNDWGGFALNGTETPYTN